MQTRVRHRSLPLNQKGFTLIELAVVLVIIGIVLTVMTSVLPSLIQSAKIKKAEAVLEKIDYALEGYITANGRCPCPDTSGDGQEDRTAGATPPSDDTCSAYAGDLPYRTLGLSSNLDAWQNPVRYAVYEDFIRTAKSGLCAEAPCSLCLRDFASNPNLAYLTTTQSSGTTSQAYLIASGGSKDMDGANGFFDGLNGSAPAMEFESPDKIIDATYDDLVRSASFTYLLGKLCSGSGGTPPPGAIGAENSYPNGCSNGSDDDGDGFVDCLDQDCFSVAPCGPGGTNVSITTSTLPSGTVNSDYSTMVQATGGTTPYEWALSAGGFTNLFLHTYTGRLSGKLNQCPGSHNVQVQVQDATLAADGGPRSDARSLTIQVTADLSVQRASGSTTDIDWTSPTQQETFQTSGGHLGNITWQLDTGGANGFAVVSAGTDTCTVKKNGATTTGTGPYTFTLTASDSGCASTNSAQLIFTVTVPSSGGGAAAPYTVDLAGEWQMDECSWNGTSAEIVDTGSQALHGTAVNGADTAEAGKICRSAGFSQTSHGIEIPDAPAIDFTGGDFSVAFWYKMLQDSSAGWDQIFVKGNGSSRNYAMWLHPGQNRIHFRVDPGNQGLDSNALLTVGAWHFITGTYASGALKLYIDGAFDRGVTGITMNAASANAQSLFIGKSPGYPTIRSQVDEFMLFQKALSETEITDLMNLSRSACLGTCYSDPLAEYRLDEASYGGVAGEVLDNGSGASNGAAVAWGTGALPTASDSNGGKVCRAAEFARIDDTNGGCLDLGDPADGDLDPYTNSWTISAWIYWNGSSSDNIIYNKENLYEAKVLGGYVQYAWQPHWYWDGGTAFPISPNTWTHVTTVYDGARQILYRNGLAVFSRDQTGPIGSNGSRLLIGARGSTNPAYFFGGKIDEVRIYDRALSESEIKALVDATRTCN